MKESIFGDHADGETFDTDRGELSYFTSEDDNLLVQYTFVYPGAISFFAYNYYFETQELLYAVPIENSKGYFLQPNEKTIGDGSYNPFSRRIFMNLLNSEEDLANTAPFLQFGMENPQLVAVAGYVSIPANEVDSMIAGRLEPALSTAEQDDGLSGGAIAGIVIATLVGVGIVAVLARKAARKGDQNSKLPESIPY